MSGESVQRTRWTNDEVHTYIYTHIVVMRCLVDLKSTLRLPIRYVFDERTENTQIMNPKLRL